MAKSGQSGNVSPATIYLYFNKQDLVNQLYLDVKVAFCGSGFKGHEPNVAVKTVLNAWFNMASFKLEHKGFFCPSAIIHL
jgi:hypothetical protein